MGRGCCLFVVIVLLHVFHSLLLRGHGEELESLSFIKCKKHEEEALLKLKQSFTKDPLNRLSSWGVGEDCCRWHGVTCDSVTHHVVELNLGVQQQYSDCMPDSLSSMESHELSSALLGLKLLTHLDLSGNNYFGSRIPEFIGSMTYLRYLNLSSATFSGPLPPQLGNLTNLEHLDLRSDCFGGVTLSSKSLGWASSLSKLKSLDMSYCDLSQAHDIFQVVTRLSSLSILGLYGCRLKNSHLLSEDLISNTSSNSVYSSRLQRLDLGSNDFKGPFPSLLKTMISLQSLSLNNNYLIGPVPIWLKAMNRLEALDLSRNEFGYVEGGILGIFGNSCYFKHLDLSFNFISQEDILESFSSVSGCGSFGLEYLDLRNNYNYMMGSSLPSMLGQLTNLVYLDLSYSRFKGRISPSFAKLSALTYLDLSHNELSGLTPDFIGHLTQIEYIDLSSNSLQGTVSGIGNLSKLSYLNLNSNHFNLNLNLSFSFNRRPPFQLQTLDVRSCVINAVFPQWLRNQTKIQYLDLSYTGISGDLPKWLWNLSGLQELYLAGNKLTGSLPQHKVGGPYDDSFFMPVLDINNNFLSGTLPNWLGDLENVQVMDLSSNMFSGEFFNGDNVYLIGSQLRMLDVSDNKLFGEIQLANNIDNLGATSYSLQILSLRGNQFVGCIPKVLCKFGSLTVLDLAHNGITGHIPRCLGSIGFKDSNTLTIEGDTGSSEFTENVKGNTEMSTFSNGFEGQIIIDLSSNQLTGTIPELLTNLSTLSGLNLSYNHLTGYIPENIRNMKAIESLDLSNNHLSGTIPKSLSLLSFLGKLNFSNNHLHGPIPTSNQLQTLDDPSIYAGNSGLYGCPLPKNCTPHDLLPTFTNTF